jgi:hypothetical protein
VSARRSQNTGASGRCPNGAGPRVDTRNRGEETDCSRRRLSGRPGARFAHLCIKVEKSSIQHAFGRPRGQ